MKTTIQISTGQYEYIMQEFDRELTPVEACDKYLALKATWHRDGGLDDKQLSTFYQNFLEGKDNHIEQLEQMSQEERRNYKALKRARNRIDYKARDEMKESEGHINSLMN